MQLLVNQPKLLLEKSLWQANLAEFNNATLDYSTVSRNQTGEKLRTILHSKEMSKQDLSANAKLHKGCLYIYYSEGFPFTNKTY